jgi:HPt (histidine-containing phosphotransfer) domain-containing protein
MTDPTSITGNTAYALTATGFSNYPPLPVIADKVCNMEYLNGITRGDEKRIGNLVDAFITEINEELALLKIAIEKTNYPEIGNISHNMKSAFAVLGIKVLEPVIKEMEQLSNKFSSIEMIKKLSHSIQLVFNQARVEIEAGI